MLLHNLVPVEYFTVREFSSCSFVTVWQDTSSSDFGSLAKVATKPRRYRPVPILFEQMKRKWCKDSLIGCLSIDACCHSSYIPPSFPSHLAESCHLDEFLQRFGEIPQSKVIHKYCFVFYHRPLDPEILCTAVYITSEASGKVKDYQVMFGWR